MSGPTDTPNTDESISIVIEAAETLARVGSAITVADDNPFGRHLEGPRTPDLQSARGTAEVQEAMNSLAAANTEIGTVQLLEAISRWVRAEFKTG